MALISKNYIILTHKNPHQLARLIKRLDDEDSWFYIHVDKKSDIDSFACIDQPNVKFIEERVSSIWGDFSLVLATLMCIEEVLQDVRQGYTILLSGQDYPVKDLNYINNYLTENAVYDHINIDLYPIPENNDEFYIRRLSHIKINLSSRRGHFILIPYFWHLNARGKAVYMLNLFRHRLLNKDVLKSLFKRKTPFKAFALGSQWWAFSFNTLNKVYNYIQEHKKNLFEFYKNVLDSDELFFHSIIVELSKKDPSIKIKPGLTYTDWTPRANQVLPITFEESDIQTLLSLSDNYLFARKFDLEVSDKILDLLDKNVGLAK